VSEPAGESKRRADDLVRRLEGLEPRRDETSPNRWTSRGSPGDQWSGFNTGWAITVTLLSGMLVWGGIGYLIDLLAGFDNVFLAVGIIVGMAAGIYLVVLRYGGTPSDGG
jgi:F0F1-type ATP synthase assembly protein I